MNREKIYTSREDRQKLEDWLKIGKDILDCNQLEELKIFVPNDFFMKLGTSGGNSVYGILYVTYNEKPLQIMKIDFLETRFSLFPINDDFVEKNEKASKEKFHFLALKRWLQYLNKYKNYGLIDIELLKRFLSQNNF